SPPREVQIVEKLKVYAKQNGVHQNQTEPSFLGRFFIEVRT
ncbi:hypothetical protein KKC_16144, partial [Listeria fleischmannii subsp. coloradonensis]